MRILIATETKVYKIDNQLFASNSFKKVLERYFDAFHEIDLCTRIQSIKTYDLPKSYENITELIENVVEIKSLVEVAFGKRNKEIKCLVQSSNLLVARVPSVVAYKAALVAKSLCIPYLVEVVGCTWDSYWNYNWMSKLIALPAFILMRKVVWNAQYATYVTEEFLQKRYPCNCDSINASNVIIDCSEEDVLERRLKRIAQKDDNKMVLFTAAAIDVAYKGQEYVIKAIPILREKGFEIEYRLAGNGNPERLKTIAQKCGVEDNIIYLGGLNRADVIAEFDQCDIYIQPSLQEGLPRSLIEAMSRGCPALGARTAGIPELISNECIFERANSSDTARAIEMMASTNQSEYARMNFNKSLEYDKPVLDKRRNEFYQRIINEIG